MKFVFSMTLALALLATAPALAWGGHGDRGDKIDVMTQNQYLGSDLTPIIAAPDPATFNQALIDALAQISANNYPARVEQLAKLIAFRRPDLVGLQEMFSFHCNDVNPDDGNQCATPLFANAFNNHLLLTEAELIKLHASYTTEAVVENLNVTLPVFLNADLVPDILVTVIDRDVILARGDVDAAAVPFSAICGQGGLPGVPGANGSPGCNYENVARVDTSLGVPVIVQRGFVGVDALVDGKLYRFVNTHLEVQNLVPVDGDWPEDWVWGGAVQAAQATELSALIAASIALLPNPLGAPSPIVVGDINSGPTDGIFFDPLFPDPDNPSVPPTIPLTPPYAQLANGTNLLGQGPWGLGPLTDAWDLKAYPTPGFSCCQDADLLNKRSKLDERIDVIFSADAPDRVKRARVLGATFWTKTWSTYPVLLWPSDHGSVAAELEFE